MFTAPALPLLNTLANASIFTDPKSEDPRWNLAAVRIRVEGDVLDATASTSFVIGQGRTAGSGIGESWEVLVLATALKPVFAALRRARGNAAVERTASHGVRFTVGDQVLELAGAEGSLPNLDSLFPAVTDHVSTPGFSSVSPADLSRLGKLKDYTSIPKKRGQLVSPATALTIGMAPEPDKAVVATYGPDFRILIAVRRGIVMPEEQAAAGGADWRFAATCKNGN